MTDQQDTAAVLAAVLAAATADALDTIASAHSCERGSSGKVSLQRKGQSHGTDLENAE